MTESGPQRVVVCSIEDLPPGSVTRVESGGQAACVANVDGRVLAVGDVCLHKGASLSMGRLEGETITCPAHWWRYSMVDGHLSGSKAAVPSYPVEVIDGDVVIVLPAPAQKRGWRETLLAHARAEQEPRAD